MGDYEEAKAEAAQEYAAEHSDEYVQQGRDEMKEEILQLIDSQLPLREDVLDAYTLRDLRDKIEKL